jgi:archaellum component FlaF (FlaF/FlaG flagellin family)
MKISKVSAVQFCIILFCIVIFAAIYNSNLSKQKRIDEAKAKLKFDREMFVIDSVSNYYKGIQDSLNTECVTRGYKIDSLNTSVKESVSQIRNLLKIRVTEESKKKAILWIKEHNKNL